MFMSHAEKIIKEKKKNSHYAKSAKRFSIMRTSRSIIKASSELVKVHMLKNPGSQRYRSAAEVVLLISDYK